MKHEPLTLNLHQAYFESIETYVHCLNKLKLSIQNYSCWSLQYMGLNNSDSVRIALREKEAKK